MLKATFDYIMKKMKRKEKKRPHYIFIASLWCSLPQLYSHNKALYFPVWGLTRLTLWTLVFLFKNVYYYRKEKLHAMHVWKQVTTLELVLSFHFYMGSRRDQTHSPGFCYKMSLLTEPFISAASSLSEYTHIFQLAFNSLYIAPWPCTSYFSIPTSKCWKYA